MFSDFSAKEIPIQPMGMTACPDVAICCSPTSSEVISDSCCLPCDLDNGGGSTGMPQSDPQSDPDIPVACDMFVACADGTAEQACFQTFAPLCTGHGGVIGDPFNRYQEQEEAETIFVKCNDGSFDTLRRNGVKPCLTRGGEVEEFDTRTDAQREADLAEIRAGWEGGSESGGDGDRPVSQGGMIPDDVYYGVGQQPVEDDACYGTMCIALYKPCPEGYIDGNPCCPNTGNCVPDPNYVGVAKPALPIGQTPSTNFDIETEFPTAQPIRMEIPVRSSTPLPFERTTTAPTTSTTEPLTAETSTTETSTAEEPKEGGLGILVLGLIALEALAT